MCGMTNTTGSGEGKPMELYSGDEWFTQELAKFRNERDCWLETARQEFNGREYYRSLVVKIGEMFGVSAKTCDDGTVVEDVLCAKVSELVSAALRREEVLRVALDTMLKSAVPHPVEHPTMTAAWKTARAALSACDEGRK